jgi:hypothetical protein
MVEIPTLEPLTIDFIMCVDVTRIDEHSFWQISGQSQQIRNDLLLMLETALQKVEAEGDDGVLGLAVQTENASSIFLWTVFEENIHLQKKIMRWVSEKINFWTYGHGWRPNFSVMVLPSPMASV